MGFLDEFLTKEDKEFKHLLTIYPSKIEETLCVAADQIFEARFVLNEARKKVRRAKFNLEQKEYLVTQSYWNRFYIKQNDDPKLKKPTNDEVKRKVKSHYSYIEETELVFDAEDVADNLRVRLDSLMERNNLLQTLANYKANTTATM